MNGQMHQICALSAATREALRTGEPIAYSPAPYENAITFAFLPERRLWGVRTYAAPGVPAWYAHARRKGLRDVKFLCPIAVGDRGLLGFSNTSQSAILCAYRGEKASYFIPDWRFDPEAKRWNVAYSEHECRVPSLAGIRFDDPSDSFKRVLSEIGDFAARIGCESFARVFASAKAVLDGAGAHPDKGQGIALAQLPARNLRIFEAAGLADVFGAMGSWNDGPPYMAHKLGLDAEYERLSAELLRQVRLSLLYAVNEW